jgi:adenine-specific DNA-methyltransferase
VRYIGNKTRLRSFIRRVLRTRGVQCGRALDPFCGTASVSRSLKRWKFSVIAGDVMRYAYVFARAYVQTTARPKNLPALLKDIDALEPEHGFITENYSVAGGRMYFTPENAARIDAIRRYLNELAVDDDAHYVLLAALIEAADRVANTTGVYAAFVKSWQPNARRPLDLRLERVINGNSCYAHQRDAAELVEEAGPVEVLYLDPPYNTRQYPGYYHVPELIATGWFDQTPLLRGKTGLLEDSDKRSEWCSRARAEDAFARLLEKAQFKHLMLSYSGEGILTEESIERLLRQYGRSATYQRHAHGYKRYRSDADGEHRQYKGDAVREYLYCVSR